jgi:hypothetical protein
VATISSLLADHVMLQVRSVDRLFLQGYVPRLQTQAQVIRFLLDRGFPIPSPASTDAGRRSLNVPAACADRGGGVS